MVLLKQNQLGFEPVTPGDPTQPLLSADVLNGWQRNLARAVRGGATGTATAAGGGRWTPVRPITIDRFSSDALGDVRVGPGAELVRAASAHWPLRLTVLDWEALSYGHIFDTTDGDLIMSDGTNLTGSLDVILRVNTGTPTPQAGDVLRFSRPLEGAQILRFYSDTIVGGNLRATFPSAYSNQIAGTPFYASFYFDAGTGHWERLEQSGDVA